MLDKLKCQTGSDTCLKTFFLLVTRLAEYDALQPFKYIETTLNRHCWNDIVARCVSHPSEPATFVRLPNVFQTSMAFGTRWVVVIQTSLVHWGDIIQRHICAGC